MKDMSGFLGSVPLRRGHVSVLAGALAFLSVGCGGDCRSLCEAMVEEECWGDDGPDDDDCEDNCEDDAEIVEEAGCEDDYDAFIECGNDLEDVCDVTPRRECTTEISGGTVTTTCVPIEPEACGAEWERVRDCLQSYCDDHPDDSDCS